MMFFRAMQIEMICDHAASADNFQIGGGYDDLTVSYKIYYPITHQIRDVNFQSCLFINFQYKPISLCLAVLI